MSANGTVPKVALAVPYYRHIEGPTTFCLMSLVGASVGRVGIMPFECSGAYIEDNRNGAVRFALETGIDFDWLMWIDGDMTFPQDAMLRLIAHDKDIVGANYRTRAAPHHFAGQYWDGMDTHLMEPGLHRMKALPTGLLLTRFDIYRKMPYPWFKPGTKDEARDDIYFCREAVKIGYEIWCDHDLTFEVGHIATQQIPWFRPDQILVRGAQLNKEWGDKDIAARARAAGAQVPAD